MVHQCLPTFEKLVMRMHAMQTQQKVLETGINKSVFLSLRSLEGMAGQKTSNQSSWYFARATRPPNKTTRESIFDVTTKGFITSPSLVHCPTFWLSGWRRAALSSYRLAFI